MEYQQHEFLRINRTRILYNQSVVTFLFPIIAAIALCIILWPVSNHLHISLWAGIVIAYSLARYLLIWKQRQQELTSDNAAKWLDIFTINVFVSGVLWGPAPIILIPYRADALIEFTLYNSLTLIIICGLVAGAVVSYSISKQVLLAYAVPALVPPSFYLISLGDKYNSALGGFVLLYLIFISISSFRLHNQYRQYMDMQYRLHRLENDYEKLKETLPK